MQRTTKMVRCTLTPAVAGEALNVGPVFAAPFHTPGNPAGVAYSYAGSHNPTWTALEQAIGAIEHPEARALVFASGMAALAAVFGVTLRPGDVVVLDEDGYSGARKLLSGYFGELGVEIRAVPFGELGTAQTLAGARLLWLETPSNPMLAISDIAAMAAAAHEAGALVAVDNTTATALRQSPLALGADWSVASDSKALTGHSDLLLGHVATRDVALFEKLEQYRGMHGAALGPMEAWLALRSLPTLPLRLERMCGNALGIAEFLAGRAEVREVLYPGLPGRSGHAVAARQMTHFGPVVSFTLADQAAAETFLLRAELITEATSFGGMVTTAERRGRWGNDRVAPGFIRLSAGCEDLGDLIADMKQALEAG